MRKPNNKYNRTAYPKLKAKFYRFRYPIFFFRLNSVNSNRESKHDPQQVWQTSRLAGKLHEFLLVRISNISGWGIQQWGRMQGIRWESYSEWLQIKFTFALKSVPVDFHCFIAFVDKIRSLNQIEPGRYFRCYFDESSRGAIKLSPGNLHEFPSTRTFRIFAQGKLAPLPNDRCNSLQFRIKFTNHTDKLVIGCELVAKVGSNCTTELWRLLIIFCRDYND